MPPLPDAHRILYILHRQVVKKHLELVQGGVFAKLHAFRFRNVMEETKRHREEALERGNEKLFHKYCAKLRSCIHLTAPGLRQSQTDRQSLAAKLQTEPEVKSDTAAETAEKDPRGAAPEGIPRNTASSWNSEAAELPVARESMSSWASESAELPAARETTSSWASESAEVPKVNKLPDEDAKQVDIKHEQLDENGLTDAGKEATSTQNVFKEAAPTENDFHSLEVHRSSIAQPRIMTWWNLELEPSIAAAEAERQLLLGTQYSC